MNRMHFDLETLGTRYDSTILAIGVAVVSDTSGLLCSNVFYPCLDEQDSIQHIDHNTISWWMKQSEEARRLTFVSKEARIPFSTCLHSIGRMIDLNQVEEVWGNGPLMDIALIENMALSLDMSSMVPWNFRQVRDLRTLRMLSPDISRHEPQVAHSAQHDAIAQGLWAREMIEWLKK